MPSKKTTIQLELAAWEFDAAVHFNVASADHLTLLVMEGGTSDECDAVLDKLARLPNMMYIYKAAWSKGYEAGKEDYQDA